MNYWTQSPRNIYVAAHRGWRSRYPENTMEAFAAAEALGVDQIELDVRSTKDGELVVIHDATVDRTTDGSGAVRDMTLAEVKALDAGIRAGEEFAGCRVPEFEAFMERIAANPAITLDIELKEYPSDVGEKSAYDVCDRVLRIVDRYGFTDRAVINSFSAELLEYVYGKYGKRYRLHTYYPRTVLKRISLDPYSYPYCCCMCAEEPGQPVAGKEACDTMAARGVQPWAGAGVKDAETVDKAIESGVYLITCNNPDEILRLLRERGRHN